MAEKCSSTTSMLNIVIDCKDNLYRQGLVFLLHQIFEKKFSQTLIFSNKLNAPSVAEANIIVKHLQPGESGLCNQVLRHRQPNSLLIGLYDGNHNPYYAELPLCFKDIVFVNRVGSLSTVRKLIERGWEDALANALTPFKKGCQDCRHRQLSPQQIKIAEHIFAGEVTDEIARALNINVKTVGAHKRMIMIKFNLNSDFELLNFLHLLKNQNLAPMYSHDIAVGKY